MVRNLIETSPLGSSEQQQFEFLPNTIDRLGKQQYSSDLFNGIEFSTLVFDIRPKEGVLGYGYDKSDKTTWIYAQFQIIADLKKITNLNNLFKLIEGLEQNPQIAVDAMSDITRTYFGMHISFLQDIGNEKAAKALRGFQTRGEAAAQAEQPEEQKTELTEAKKKIIRENLLKLLRRNKGRK